MSYSRQILFDYNLLTTSYKTTYLIFCYTLDNIVTLFDHNINENVQSDKFFHNSNKIQNNDEHKNHFFYFNIFEKFEIFKSYY